LVEHKCKNGGWLAGEKIRDFLNQTLTTCRRRM